MKIFYDEDFDSYDCMVDGNIHAEYYSYSIGRWDLIRVVAIGGRQIPDTVLILIGAPKLEIKE